jgi:sulfite reductase (NADPH) flavoprotein alpha-component
VAANPQDIIAPVLDAADLSALQQTVSRFDREQLIWGSGYLAGLAGSTAAIEAPLSGRTETTTDTWHVFFATETGNSRSVAENLATAAGAAGIATELHDLSNTRPKVLKTISNAIFVLATHGIGEAPEGSEAFFEFWMSDKAPQLPDLNFSVLALGDSSYADYCEMGRVFESRLLVLGGTSIAERVDCDLDFESVAKVWTKKVIEHARETSTEINFPQPVRLSAVASTPLYSKRNPFAAEILTRQVITGRDSSKHVQHIELDLEGSGLIYQPGDSLAVLPSNPPQIVAQLATITGLDEHLFAEKEITALSRPILDAVATDHPDLQAILDDREQFTSYLATRQLIDLVHEYPFDWQQPQFINALRKLSPRSYSIASSLDANPDEVHLTVDVVDYEQFGRRHLGAASNFLISETSHAQVFIEPNDNFSVPAPVLHRTARLLNTAGSTTTPAITGWYSVTAICPAISSTSLNGCAIAKKGC